MCSTSECCCFQTAATFTKTDSFDLSNVKTKSSREPATSEVKHKDVIMIYVVVFFNNNGVYFSQMCFR